MTAAIISGKEISAKVKEDLKQEVVLLAQQGIVPGLTVVIVGDNSASRVYVNHKKKACEQLGIRSEEYALPRKTTQQELIELVERLNGDDAVHGILVQLPLPRTY